MGWKEEAQVRLGLIIHVSYCNDWSLSRYFDLSLLHLYCIQN